MELEPRSTAPAHATGAVEFVPLADVSDDATFRLRDEGDVSALAASIGRLGQLAPVELRPLPGTNGGPRRWQVIAGFRRLAAVRLLARERVLARVHAELSDEDAWGIALADALLTEPLLASEVEALGERLQESGAAPWAEELLPDALARSPVEPHLRERYLGLLEGGAEAEAAGYDVDVHAEAEVERETEPGAGEAGADAAGDETIEVTPEELVEDLAHRMYALNQDLALAAEAWAELPPEGRRMILAQASYVARLLPLLEEREP